MKISRLAYIWLASANSRNRPREKYMLEFEKFFQAGFRESFTTQAKSRVTRETLHLIILFASFHIPLPILYKSLLPTECKKNKESLQETFERENPSQPFKS